MKEAVDQPYQVQWNPSGNNLLVGTQSGKIIYYDAESGKPLTTIKDSPGCVCNFDFNKSNE